MQPWKRETREKFKGSEMHFRKGEENEKDVESDVQKEPWTCKCEERQFLEGENRETPMSCHINLYKA